MEEKLNITNMAILTDVYLGFPHSRQNMPE
jgi:hypothetical protein